jgi:YHS domain-containing protein
MESRKEPEVKSLICPTCGCSLVRLGVSREAAARAQYGGTEHLFCCEGCREIFASDPERYLEQVRNVVVCPVCLGEKPVAVTVAVEYEGTVVHLCGCPGCTNRFRADPEPLLARLAA